MNKKIIEILSNYPKNENEYTFTHYNNLAIRFNDWVTYGSGFYTKEEQREFSKYRINSKPKIIPAGKNFRSFDYEFLQYVPKFMDLIEFSRRTIDPALLYVDWKNDEELPDTPTCNKRAGVINEYVHNALFDCWDIVQLLRLKY
jgi:hypothetical protein